MLLEVSLLSLKCGYLALQFIVFILLVQIPLLHVFLSLQHVRCQLLANVLSLPGQIVVQTFFLRSERADLLLIEDELLSEAPDGFF